jgi:integral membrane sensor domain MASE1/DNA-binding CsgD family transcriptional regulator
MTRANKNSNQMLSTLAEVARAPQLNDQRWQRAIRLLAKLVIVGFAYFTLALLGLRLASINPSATPIWPPTGVAIACLLLFGYRIAPAIFVSAFLTNQLTTGSVFTSLAIAGGNTLEPLIAVYLVRCWAGGDQVLDTPTNVARFALISLTATLVSATIGVSSLAFAGYAEASNFVPIWLTWWLGDLAGAVVVAPVVVLWAKSERVSLAPPQIARTGLTYLAAVAIGLVVFSPMLQQTAYRDALAFLTVLPLLLWASLRQGPRDTATVALIISGFAIWGTLMHGGPFAKLSLNDSFMLLLAFMISTSLLSLALSTEVAVTHRVESEQRRHALEMEVLWQATLQVAFGGSFEDLLRGCLERICRLTGWPAGHVYLPDGKKQPSCLHFGSVWHFERQELAPLAHEIAGVCLCGEGLSDKVWTMEKQPSPADLPHPLPLGARRRTLNKHGLRAAFGLPLYAEGKVQAIVEFFSCTRQPPDDHLLHIVGSIGEQLGRALERGQTREQQRQTIAISSALSLTTMRSQALESTLDALTSGVYLTDRHGQIIYMNRPAEQQVDTGNVIRIAKSRLVSNNHMANIQLAKAIESAIGDEVDLVSGDLSIALPGQDDAGLIATVLPLARGEGLGMAAVFVRDTRLSPTIPGEALAELFGLTRSELRVLLEMAEGACVKKASRKLEISETTTKTHLQHIYAKTRTSKQTDLMRLIMSFTPPINAA